MGQGMYPPLTGNVGQAANVFTYCITDQHSGRTRSGVESLKTREIEIRQLEKCFPDVKTCGHRVFTSQNKSIDKRARSFLKNIRITQYMELRGRYAGDFMMDPG